MRTSIAILFSLTMAACASQAQYADTAEDLCKAKQLQPGTPDFSQCVAEQQGAPKERQGIRYCRRGVFCQTFK